MERPMTHPELREMLGLYALGALETNAAAALEVHLQGCAACVEELADLEETTGELARVARPVTPSPDVTRRILEAPRSEPRRPVDRLPAAAARDVRRERRAGSMPLPHRRLVPVAAGVAVAAVLAVLVVSHVDLRRRLDRTSETLARGRELLDFMSSPHVVTVSLAATESMPAARALVSLDRRAGRVVFLAFNLPPPPAGQVYQLWAISEGVRPAAVFSPETPGPTLFQGQWLSEGAEIPHFGVTLEPSPGVPDPTGKMLLFGPARG